MHQPVSRRRLLKTIGAAASAAVASRGQTHGQTRGQTSGQTSGQTPQGPPSTVTTPPRDFGPNAPPTTYFTDPDIITVDPRFGAYIQANTPIKRLWTGALWAEGPAWSSQGRYLVWSDIPNDRLLRWLEDDKRVTVFRGPA